MSSKSKQSESQAPAAVIVEQAASKQPKLHKSTIEAPVANTWRIAHELCVRARRNGEPVPTRKFLVDTCIAAGIATDTAKTQVQQYLKASLGGTVTPTRGPRNLQFVD